MSSAQKISASAPNEAAKTQQNTRETVESIVVAFILAFLFRAFVAEAFVIPTGSMAPTLMGAHKDIACEHCGAPYQSTASLEFYQDSGKLSGRTAVGSTCSVCRGENAFDFRGNANHATFSGDRILVSKFDYLFHDPSRWDVLVFKFPEDARMNYIKRLVGLPGEQLLIEEGDVYTRKLSSDPWRIARKPPHKIQAMSQVVSDTNYLAKEMIDAGWPSLWQSWPPPEASTEASNWNIRQSNEKWSAELIPDSANSAETKWLRYFHQVLNDHSWKALSHGEAIPAAAYNVNLITDFLAYNTSRHTNRESVYDKRGRLRPEITRENRALDEVHFSTIGTDGGEDSANDGLHWVGDLVADFDIEVIGDTGTLSVDLVEFGIHYRCSIDVATGKATLEALDGSVPINAFGSDSSPAIIRPVANTRLQGSGRYALKFANFDDRIVLWVNGSAASFDSSTDFESRRFRAANSRRPHWTQSDPLDAAPIGIGSQGVALKVHRARVGRDIYYIAINQNYYSDYNMRDFESLVGAIPDPTFRSEVARLPISGVEKSWSAIRSIYSQPEWWASTNLFRQRRAIEFQLADDHFFPMGDNSAASSDARAWNKQNYVERRYLIGKALLVFWPHYWRSPVPFFPNFSRMRLIR